MIIIFLLKRNLHLNMYVWKDIQIENDHSIEVLPFSWEKFRWLLVVSNLNHLFQGLQLKLRKPEKHPLPWETNKKINKKQRPDVKFWPWLCAYVYL